MAFGKLGSMGKGFGKQGSVLQGTMGPLWTPAQLGAALVAYLDPMDSTPVVSGGTMSALPNASFASGGAAWDLAQATVADQPAYGATVFNGFPGFSLVDGTDFIESSAAALPQPFTRVSLFRPKAIASGFHLVNSRQNTPNTGLFMGSADSPVYMYAGGFVTVGYIVDNSYYIVNESYNGASSVGTLNAVASGSADVGTTGIEGVRVGVGPSAADIATVAIINRGLTASEQAKLRGYMVWRRGLASILPGGDPYKLRPPYVSDP